MRVVLFVWCLVAAPAFAFGPAVHAYIGMRVVGETDPGVAFAAALPDVNGVFHANARAEACVKQLTHHAFTRWADSRVAAGFATHNGVWGADGIAHAYFTPSAPDNYVTGKLRALSERCGITLHESEDLFDAALDLTMAQAVGPALGKALVASARTVGREEEDAFVAAFAPALTEDTGMTPGDAALQLRWAMRCMKSGLAAYGSLLQLKLERQKPLAFYLVGKVFDWTPAEARERLNAALALAADCAPALDAISDDIRAHMLSDPSYAPWIASP